MIDSKLIRELRSKASWSQEDLAAASGLSLRTIQRGEIAIGSAFLIIGSASLMDLETINLTPVLLIAAGCLLVISTRVK